MFRPWSSQCLILKRVHRKLLPLSGWIYAYWEERQQEQHVRNGAVLQACFSWSLAIVVVRRRLT